MIERIIEYHVKVEGVGTPSMVPILTTATTILITNSRTSSPTPPAMVHDNQIVAAQKQERAHLI